MVLVCAEVTRLANRPGVAIEVSARAWTCSVDDAARARGAEVIVERQSVRAHEAKRIVDETCTWRFDRVAVRANAEGLNGPGRTAEIAKDDVVGRDEPRLIAEYSAGARAAATRQ